MGPDAVKTLTRVCKEREGERAAASLANTSGEKTVASGSGGTRLALYRGGFRLRSDAPAACLTAFGVHASNFAFACTTSVRSDSFDPSMSPRLIAAKMACRVTPFCVAASLVEIRFTRGI